MSLRQESKVEGVHVVESTSESVRRILTPEALSFVSRLHREFNVRREELLKKRLERQKEFDAGRLPDFLSETKSVRDGDWSVVSAPKDLQNRRVEITGPTDRKMMINALTSGAQVFMADFEDSLSPTWQNVIQGQINVQDAVRRTLSYRSPEGKKYELKGELATLMIRPRGWHLVEKNVTVDHHPISASLFDFGLVMFHNADEQLKRGTGPYYYLPKLESHREARLWADVFRRSEEVLGLPKKTIKVTVLIETILAAFEMEEILYELRDYIVGLNAGRWDYIFSIIKKFRNRPDMTLPDRGQVTMAVPFMRAYTNLMIQTCHKRGAHAMGGMAAFVPSRNDPEVNRIALEQVRKDKQREAEDGCDGTWVAHPDLVPVAREIFDSTLGRNPHQKHVLRQDVKITAKDLLDFQVPGGKVTEEGFQNDVSVALQYLERWLQGVGAAAIYNLMEDTATAEISRAQLWQWLRHGVASDTRRKLTVETYKEIRDREIKNLGGLSFGKYRQAVEVLDRLVMHKDFADFLTIPAYEYL